MKNITIALGYGSNGWQAASSFQLGLPQESKDGRHSYGRGRELALQLSTAVVIGRLSWSLPAKCHDTFG